MGERGARWIRAILLHGGTFMGLEDVPGPRSGSCVMLGRGGTGGSPSERELR
jgi:hypothetical protein